MPYYWTCPYCGANLDPGEKCDCNKEEKISIHALRGEGDRRSMMVTRYL